MADSLGLLKLPKISITSRPSTSKSLQASFSHPDGIQSENENLPPLTMPMDEIAYILIILRELGLAVDKIPLLYHLTRNFSQIPDITCRFGSFTADFRTLNYYFSNSATVANATSQELFLRHHVRNSLRFIAQNRNEFEKELPQEGAVDAWAQMGLLRDLMEISDSLQQFHDLLEVSLATTYDEDRDLEMKLQKAKISIEKLESKMQMMESEILGKSQYKEEQIGRRDAKIRILNSNLEAFVSQSAERLEIIRQEQIAAIQKVNNYNLQREWVMHRKIKEISVEMRALRRANSDTEYLLKQRTNDSEELVAELLKQYDNSMGLSKVTLANVDYELQEEILSLQHLENKAQQLEDELNQIVKEREEEEERRQQRVQKLKQRFRLVAKIHAYFSKEQKPAAAKSTTKKRSSIKKP